MIDAHLAPISLADWFSRNRHKDKKTGRVYQYHPRSDSHSIALCQAVLRDLVAFCPTLRAQADLGALAFGINCPVLMPATGKTKTLDLAVGTRPVGERSHAQRGLHEGNIATLLFACEAKTVMTEHSKSKPRVYDELSSSHEIVHQGWPSAIATGLTVVNLASTFISPLRNQRRRAPVEVSRHAQPAAAAGMVAHLRGLQQRDAVGTPGFDAYATIVLECANDGSEVRAVTAPPAPQEGAADHYATFLARVDRLWSTRFGMLPA